MAIMACLLNASAVSQTVPGLRLSIVAQDSGNWERGLAAHPSSRSEISKQIETDLPEMGWVDNILSGWPGCTQEAESFQKISLLPLVQLAVN
jgi:hypothetical protein